tara:strand:+ start:188 stop:361 length:174 start_codon:yes stop_codon:yes gene_type:complete
MVKYPAETIASNASSILFIVSTHSSFGQNTDGGETADSVTNYQCSIPKENGLRSLIV